MENIHRKGLGGPDSPDNEDAYHLGGEEDHSPRNDNQPDYNNLIQQRNQLNQHALGGLQQVSNIVKPFPVHWHFYVQNKMNVCKL